MKCPECGSSIKQKKPRKGAEGIVLVCPKCGAWIAIQK